MTYGIIVIKIATELDMFLYNLSGKRYGYIIKGTSLMSIIIFDRKVGRQIKINKRAEFTFPNKYGQEIENLNDFPQQYRVIIGQEIYSGGLYKNPRPYYYFEIHKSGHNSFFNVVENKETFHVKVELINKIVYIE